MTRRIPPIRLAAAGLGAVALLLAAAAGGAPVNAYTASSEPAIVKPSTPFTYTIRLTNNADSPERAQRARIGIPTGFSVSSPMSATTSAAGTCTASSWEPTPIVDGAVEFKKPGGGNANELCPGGTLTISITASAPNEGVWTWTTELLRDTAFALQGSQPTVRVDGTRPVAAIDASPANPSNDSSPSFMFSADEPGVSFECKLDGGTFTACLSPKPYGPLADGEHTFQLRGTDQAANIGPTVTYAWTIATVAPLTTIDSAPPIHSNSASATFAFSTTASGSTFECKLDDGALAPCTSPHEYGELADGSHSFQVRATDAATNTGSPIGHEWTVDTVPPNATIETKPPNLGRSTSATFTFSANESGTTFECELDGGGFTACVSPKAYNSLTDGVHTFSVHAIDRAGNVGLAATHPWTVDTAPPNTTVTDAPPAASASAAASFSFTATELGSSFECKLDLAPYAVCASPQNYGSLSDGTHSFSVRAIDGAGNVDQTPGSVGWLVDTVPPNTTIAVKPPSLTNTSTAAFTFTSNETATFACKLDFEAAFSSCTASTIYTNLPDGEHIVTVRASDPAGNVDSSPASHTWTVDTAAPQTTIGSTPPNPSASGVASFTFSSSEPSSTFECKMDSGSYTACSSPKSYSLLDGLHTFEVRATDAAKNADGTAATYAWRIDTAEPDTTITSAPSGSVSSPDATIAFSSPDAGVTFECRRDNAAFAECTSPKPYSNLPEGPHMFEVRARDSAGNTDLTPAAASWIVDVTRPDTSILSGPADPTNSSDATISFDSSESAVTYQCKLNTGVFVACMSPKAYVNLSETAHTVQVRATDAAGNVDASPASHSWTIDQTPPPTTINSGPDSPTNNRDATFTFSSSDPSAVFDCQLDDGPYVLCPSPKSYDDLPDGSHAFSVRARDPAGNVDPTPATRTWTVDTAAPAPTITLPVAGSATNDTTPAFAGTAGSALDDSAIVTVRVYAGPVVTGAPIQTFSVLRVAGGWSGASGLLAEGVYTARAEQRDAAGNTGYSSPTTFTVDTGGPGAAITERPADPSIEGTATFRFASNDPAATFMCRLDAGDFTPCSSPVTYQELAPGQHIFAVNATDRAGNTGGNATYSWTIVVPPLPPTSAPPPPPAVLPSAPDVVPPREVASVRVKAANAAVTLTWALPADPDFDHVSVTRTAPGKGARATTIYQGSGRSLTDRRLKNGVRYRYRIATSDTAGNSSAGVVVAATPQAPLIAPLNGATVRTPPLLRWQAPRTATYYNVQVWLVQKSGQAKAVRPVKVLSAWPSAPRLKLSSRWTFDRKAYRLVPGRYRWYVWPGLGKRSAERYGPMLGESSFIVKP